ncbi:hypothetical protein [uncultured Porticoccus sp.]|uniref:hypothetical protein n=1 Tax=uncultured Porticoccus sp. TaxID=1256050 RepID=UPI00260F06DC|nr:hypothetical protein [uncultured Porticoccus sp.]
MIFNSVAAKDVTGNFQVADGVAIYIGLMPAQVVQGHPAAHEESRMHGGVPGGGSPVHLVVTLFDDATGQRITEAFVKAEVVELGLTPQRKELEMMHIADTVSYGNYFSLRSEGPYRIRLKIRLPEREKVVEATFSHNHKPK